MPRGGATQSASCNQSTASSGIDVCQDSALFSNDIAMLHDGSGDSPSPIRTDCIESPGTVQMQNDRYGDGIDAQAPMYPLPSTTSGPPSHSCQPPAYVVGRLLNTSPCKAVIFWFPCAPNAELLKALLQGGSAYCSEHANGITRCCLPGNTNTCCLQCPRGSEHADQSFCATKPLKPCNDRDQCPIPPDGTMNPSTLSLAAGTTNILQRHFKCNYSDCKQYFKRQKTLDRHLENHIGERLHVCWVPGCQRSFSRSDNLNAHYTTHETHRGRNRYVATLDKANPIYDPKFRGQLTPQGWLLGDGGYD